MRVEQAGGIKTARLVEGKVFDVFDVLIWMGRASSRSQGGFFLLGDISGLCGLVPGRFTGPFDAATGANSEGNKT